MLHQSFLMGYSLVLFEPIASRPYRTAKAFTPGYTSIKIRSRFSQTLDLGRRRFDTSYERY